MEIKVGDYVRTNKGNITKMSSEEFIKIMLENKSIFGKALKHSKNIIDLVEVGDIVHIKDILHEDITYIWSEDYLKALKEDIQNGIKLVSIVTKEQMQSIEYKVEEDR